jgi:large subunit ribosomal protein L6
MATSHCTRSSRVLWSTFAPPRSQAITVPAFLVPALHSATQTSNFSTTASRPSKIGSAPLSLPPDVKVTVSAPAASRAGRGVSRNQAGNQVEIEGPLGKMKMAIPAYMSIAADEASRTQTLSILDADDRKQREMWGV